MNAGVLPAELGVILSNVTTIAFVGKYFRTGMPLVSKRVTVDGDAVAQPKNVIVPIGARICDVIEFCGGYKQEPRKILMGGFLQRKSSSKRRNCLHQLRQMSQSLSFRTDTYGAGQGI